MNARRIRGACNSGVRHASEKKVIVVNRNGIPIFNEPDYPCKKNSYASRIAARVAALAVGFRLSQYFCARCASWHNTKKAGGPS